MNPPSPSSPIRTIFGNSEIQQPSSLLLSTPARTNPPSPSSPIRTVYVSPEVQRLSSSRSSTVSLPTPEGKAFAKATEKNRDKTHTSHSVSSTVMKGRPYIFPLQQLTSGKPMSQQMPSYRSASYSRRMPSSSNQVSFPRRMSSSHRMLFSSHQRSSSRQMPYSRPSSSRQMPSSSRQMPSSSRQTPSSSHQMPSSSPQMPSSSPQTPSSSHQMPSSSPQMPSSSRQMPVISLSLEGINGKWVKFFEQIIHLAHLKSNPQQSVYAVKKNIQDFLRHQISAEMFVNNLTPIFGSYQPHLILFFQEAPSAPAPFAFASYNVNERDDDYVEFVAADDVQFVAADDVQFVAADDFRIVGVDNVLNL